MIAVERDPRRSAAVAALAVAASFVFLLSRPGLRGVPDEAAVLLAGYALVAAAAAIAPIPPIALIPPTGESPAIPGPVVLAVGIAAVVAAAASAGRPVPVPATWLAPVMNVAAGVAEEALFRRVAYAWLVRLGVPVAIGACAVTFALVHVPVYGPESLPVDLGAGLLLSWQRAASGTWTVPAATHVAANLVASIG